MDKIRLNKFISDSGYCSRREADTFIEQGRVTVNRVDCTEKGTLIFPTDRVEVDGEHIRTNTERIYIILNKPAGITCTTDTEDKTNIIDFVGHKERIFPIGRLDKLSQGLIFMTNDGDIVNKILRAGNSHEKEYIVTVDKPITDRFVKQMSSGVYIDLGVKTRPCKVTRENETRFRIILTQGLNRQIRRMCQTLHYDVKKLQRVRIMNITLAGIAEGKWRNFTDEEFAELNNAIKGSTGIATSEIGSAQRVGHGSVSGIKHDPTHSSAKGRGNGSGRSSENATGHGRSSENATGHGRSSENATRHGRSSENATRHGRSSENATRHGRSSENATGHGRSSENATGHGRSSEKPTMTKSSNKSDTPKSTSQKPHKNSSTSSNRRGVSAFGEKPQKSFNQYRKAGKSSTSGKKSH